MAKKGTLSRRSFLTRVAGATVATGAGAVITGASEAQNYTGQTDADTGSYADRAGYGRTGRTDSDGGANADRAGYGRGGGSTGVTDSDTGNYADPIGNGRGGRTSRITDSDTGSYADPVGNGRPLLLAVPRCAAGFDERRHSKSGGCA